MSRSRDIALVSLVTLASAATAWAWLAAGPLSLDEITATAGPATSPPRESRGGEVDDPIQSVPPPARQEVLSPRIDLPRAVTVSELVRVHGQVRRSGLPVADYDLAFQPVGLGANRHDDDWDSTDEDGRFEVELRAEARYVVLNDDEGPWVTEVVVSAGERELVLDIHLPHGN